MNKKILSIAMVALSMVAFNGMAQTSADNTTKKECVEGKKACNKEMRQKKNPYEGLTLTDAQKTKLEQLDAKRAQAREQQKQAAKAEKQARKADKKAKDASRFEARKAAKKQYLEEVKAIIGPDQYVVFLENFYVDGGRQKPAKEFRQGKQDGRQGMAKHNDSKSGKNKKGGKHGKKGQNGSDRSQAERQG